MKTRRSLADDMPEPGDGTRLVIVEDRLTNTWPVLIVRDDKRAAQFDEARHGSPARRWFRDGNDVTAHTWNEIMVDAVAVHRVDSKPEAVAVPQPEPKSMSIPPTDQAEAALGIFAEQDPEQIGRWNYELTGRWLVHSGIFGSSDADPTFLFEVKPSDGTGESWTVWIDEKGLYLGDTLEEYFSDVANS